MKLYSLVGCPMCDIVKEKLTQHHIHFDYVTDKNKLTELDITHVPVLETDDGNLLSGKALMQYVNNLTQRSVNNVTIS